MASKALTKFERPVSGMTPDNATPQMEKTLLAQLRQFDLECGIEDHGMVEHTTKDGVLRYRVGSYVKRA